MAPRCRPPAANPASPNSRPRPTSCDDPPAPAALLAPTPHGAGMKRILGLVWLALIATPLRAKTPADSVPGFDGRSAMIPARDGVRLHTLIYRPVGHPEPLPFLLLRTPYGVAGSPRRYLGGYLKELAADGYIFVFQDIRGRYGSEGQFVMNRPLHDPHDSTGVDESTDTYDAVDWLLANVPANNGRVGVLGISYPGWL